MNGPRGEISLESRLVDISPSILEECDHSIYAPILNGVVSNSEPRTLNGSKRSSRKRKISDVLSIADDEFPGPRNGHAHRGSVETTTEPDVRQSSILQGSVRFQNEIDKVKKAMIGMEVSQIRPVFKAEVPSWSELFIQTQSCVSALVKKRADDVRTVQCTACITRSAFSGGCRFQNLRCFYEEAKYFLTDQSEGQSSPVFTIPRLTVPGGEEEARFLLKCIAPVLKDILQVEQSHERSANILRKSREENTRAVCDGCATTIFSGFWLCYSCGREYCLECYKEWDDSILEEKNYHLSVCRRPRGGPKLAHTKTLMVPYTRFRPDEVDRLLDKLRCDVKPEICHLPQPILSRNSPDEGLPYMQTVVGSVTLLEFQQLWSLGEPISMAGFKERFGISWTPEYFIENYGSESVEVIDVVTSTSSTSTIRDFFVGLKDSSGLEMKHLKLNDWPNVEDFSVAMPDLFQDFENALPFPIYTRRKGFLNLAAWFPPQFLPPDLGPKLYCAGASSDADNAQGTTVLHMDMSDAINIMTWSGPKPEDRPGSAVWDVFPQKDSDALKSYILGKLMKENRKVVMDDPIRRAKFYLHAGDLTRLEDEYNIKPWRIYQNPGDAVFIPAGCAHQVCNLTPCIKVACDFVSPENVQSSASIALADRKLAPLLKREDVLQLKNLIYFAYLGVTHRHEWPVEDPAQVPDTMRPALETQSVTSTDTGRASPSMRTKKPSKTFANGGKQSKRPSKIVKLPIPSIASHGIDVEAALSKVIAQYGMAATSEAWFKHLQSFIRDQ